VKIAAFAAAALLALAASAADPKPAPAQAAASGPATAVIPVKGMHCGGCTSHVTEAVKKLDGVKSVDTDLDKAQATVVFDAAKVKPDQIVAAIKSTGYEPGAPVLK
jgi:copper ion binding protein